MECNICNKKLLPKEDMEEIDELFFEEEYEDSVKFEGYYFCNDCFDKFSRGK